MNTRKGRDVHRRVRKDPRSPHWLRWSLLTVALAFALSTLQQQVFAQDAPPREECEDFTPRGRPCTLTEELWYCIENAVEAYNTCKEGAGLIEKASCYALYMIDFTACYLEAPIEKILK